MKARKLRICFAYWVLLLFFTNTAFAQPQGKVVINEYMPWTSAECGTRAEFVELLNFGPGPVDIGCYILTTGTYSVTIPPNTILKAGEFFILAGQDFIPGNCANVDSTATGVAANLNWNTCNCTNQPIPQTGDGMMKDGGPANTPVVLFDPNLNPVDAIVRALPFDATSAITTSNVNGACSPRTFNLSSMNLSYETLGMAPGKQNSFARSLDGDCNWLKQPNQSGNASNNRGGTTDITYDFDMVKPTSCEESGRGSVSIYVKHSNYAAIFPMSYTISRDVNNDGIFDFADEYLTYSDNEPPYIEIDNLPVGRFKLTVYSVKGCYLKNFDFPIIPCEPTTLPVRLLYFKKNGGLQGENRLEWLLQEVQNLQSIVVEKGSDGNKFTTDRIISNESLRGDKSYWHPVNDAAAYPFYRLKITQKNGRTFYSPVLNMASGTVPPPVRIGPNPATTKLHLQLSPIAARRISYTVYNTSGQALQRGRLFVQSGETAASIDIHLLMPGTYQLQLNGLDGSNQPIPFRFVKH